MISTMKTSRQKTLHCMFVAAQNENSGITKAMYGFDEIPIKVPMKFFIEYKKFLELI